MSSEQIAFIKKVSNLTLGEKLLRYALLVEPLTEHNICCWRNGHDGRSIASIRRVNKYFSAIITKVREEIYKKWANDFSRYTPHKHSLMFDQNGAWCCLARRPTYRDQEKEFCILFGQASFFETHIPVKYMDSNYYIRPSALWIPDVGVLIQKPVYQPVFCLIEDRFISKQEYPNEADIFVVPQTGKTWYCEYEWSKDKYKPKRVQIISLERTFKNIFSEEEPKIGCIVSYHAGAHTYCKIKLDSTDWLHNHRTLSKFLAKQCPCQLCTLTEKSPECVKQYAELEEITDVENAPYLKKFIQNVYEKIHTKEHKLRSLKRKKYELYKTEGVIAFFRDNNITGIEDIDTVEGTLYEGKDTPILVVPQGHEEKLYAASRFFGDVYAVGNYGIFARYMLMLNDICGENIWAFYGSVAGIYYVSPLLVPILFVQAPEMAYLGYKQPQSSPESYNEKRIFGYYAISTVVKGYLLYKLATYCYPFLQCGWGFLYATTPFFLSCFEAALHGFLKDPVKVSLKKLWYSWPMRHYRTVCAAKAT